MEISNPIQYLTPSQAVNPVLIDSLRTAGGLEAEILQSTRGQLLLQTRLGQLLTLNTLGFRSGERLLLRLDSEAETPRLLVRPVTPSSNSIPANCCGPNGCERAPITPPWWQATTRSMRSALKASVR